MPGLDSPPRGVLCPPLLQLGGREAFPAYREALQALCAAGEVKDVRGWCVESPDDLCHHICFKEDDYGQRTIWKQERAVRIPWILPALCSLGTEIRPSVRMARRISYILE